MPQANVTLTIYKKICRLQKYLVQRCCPVYYHCDEVLVIEAVQQHVVSLI